VPGAGMTPGVTDAVSYEAKCSSERSR
jgi:hypothetical protein